MATSSRRLFAAKQPPVAFGCPQNALIAGTRIKCFMFALIVRFQELPLFVSGPVPVAGYFGQIRGGSCESCVLVIVFLFVSPSARRHCACFLHTYAYRICRYFLRSHMTAFRRPVKFRWPRLWQRLPRQCAPHTFTFPFSIHPFSENLSCSSIFTFAQVHHPSFGYVNSCDGGRSHLNCDVRNFFSFSSFIFIHRAFDL